MLITSEDGDDKRYVLFTSALVKGERKFVVKFKDEYSKSWAWLDDDAVEMLIEELETYLKLKRQIAMKWTSFAVFQRTVLRLDTCSVLCTCCEWI